MKTLALNLVASGFSLQLALLIFPVHAASVPESAPAGLSAPDWSSIRQQYEQECHAVLPSDGGYRARNSGQQWQTRFDGRGFLIQPNAGGWHWGLELKGYGFSGAERRVEGQPRVNTAGQRVTYDWDATLQEWFVNDQHGLEHGFMVRERPAQTRATDRRAELHEAQTSAGDSRSSSPRSAPALNPEPPTLDFLLAVRGGLRPEVQADGRSVRFMDEQGVTALTYSELAVLDADLRKLPARFAPVADGLRLMIDERGARYPLIIDPIAQQAYLKASNTETSDHFSTSVSVSGDTVVVGSAGEDSNATGVNGNQNDNSAGQAGAAYVFVRTGTTWGQQAYLKASNTEAGDGFGVSVAMSGDTVVVGAMFESSNATGANGDQNDNSAKSAGAAYVFVRNGTNWSQQAYLKPSNTAPYENFGRSVAVSGDTMVVGAAGEGSSATGVNGNQSDHSAGGSGAAYIYVRNGTNWSQQAYLKASNTESDDRFGISVSVSGDTVAVGAYQEGSNATGVDGNQSDNSAQWSGAAYLFVRNGTTWSQQAYLKASNTGMYDYFGIAVAVSGDTVVVGAPQEGSNATGVNGNQNDNSAQWSGATYVFVRNGTTWSQEAYLKASNTGAYDQFGISVAVSGDLVVVGAYNEDSNATGVNGNQSDNSTGDSGAAYVFVRQGTTWSQPAFLKASNTGTGDEFGYPVAVSGATVVVGANWESSGATGVNGDQSDNSALSSGAAYIFAGFSNGPQLAFEFNGDALQLSWPAATTGFVLQSATTLANGGDWQDSSLTPTETNGQKVVTITPSELRGFFRLRGP